MERQFYSELMRGICDELKCPLQSLVELTRYGDEKFQVRVLLAIRKRGRFVVSSDNFERSDYVMDKAKFAGVNLTAMFYSALRRLEEGLEERVYNAAVEEERESGYLLYSR